MDNDFKRPLGPVVRQPEPAHTQLAEETEPPTQPFTPEPEKKKRSKALIFVSILLLIALASAGALAYLWYQEQQNVATAREESTRLQETLDAANNDNITDAKTQEATDKIASFGTFSTEYDDIMAADVGTTIDRDKASDDIEAALEDYYKLDTLPEGWAILSIYQVVKPDTPPGGDLNALVYWPASDDKPAAFLPLIKPLNGTWKYEESL